ncbi:hypothetical protein H0H93_014239, partial [Arthromyces matolae]
TRKSTAVPVQPLDIKKRVKASEAAAKRSRESSASSSRRNLTKVEDRRAFLENDPWAANVRP